MKLKVFATALILALPLIPSPLHAQKRASAVNCSEDACVKNCIKVTPSSQHCRTYCVKAISDRKTSGQCPK